MKKALRIAALMLALCISFLFSPAPTADDKHCGEYMRLGDLGFMVNCDSYDFLIAARDPARLLEQNERRQSRPLFVLLGSALGYPLTWASDGLSRLGVLNAEVLQRVPANYRDLIGFHLGFVLLNFVVLFTSLWLFAELQAAFTVGRGDPFVLYGLMVFLASNQVTKTFFWSAHVQMFTLLTPLLCLWLLVRLRSRRHTAAELIGLSFGLGLLMLVYGSFLLCLPFVLYGLYRSPSRAPGVVRLALNAVLIVVAFLASTLLWILLLRARGVTYYSFEIQHYHQFVWLWEVLSGAPEILRRPDPWKLLATLPAISPFLIAVSLLAFLRKWRPSAQGEASMLEHRSTIFFSLAVVGVFIVLLGYYEERLTFGLVPCLVCLLMLQLHDLRGRYQRPLLLLACVGWHGYVVFSHGPFD